jgi:hypothetical protein
LEKELFLMLQQINEKLDLHTEILNKHSLKLDEHSQILNEHTRILGEHSHFLGEHSHKLNHHSETLKEQGVILGALMTGQELLRAEISELRIQNAKDFGEVKAKIEDIKLDVDLLKEENWNNQKNIRRVEQALGMS